MESIEILNHKNRILGVDFLRAFCAIGIIFFHFACYGGGNGNFANGEWGHIFISIFFIISGGMLYRNYPQIESIGKFYYRRIKAIYPSFYIAFGVFFLRNVIRSKHFFYKNNTSPFSIVLTLLGVDGYFSYAIPNYYILGEWFLGAIIMLYVLYPFNRYWFERNPVGTLLVSTLLFVTVYFYNVFDVSKMRNLFTCNFCFMIGMALLRYQKILRSKILFGIAVGVTVLLLTVYINMDNNLLLELFFSLCLFIALFNIGQWLMNISIFMKTVLFISGISYQIFLLQNIIIMKVISVYIPHDKNSYYICELTAMVIIVICATILNHLSKRLINSTAFKDFENVLLKKDTR